MIPLLLPPDTVDFSTRGLGPLNFALSCQVKEEINGVFDLTMKYPATAKRADQIQYRSLIMATPSPDRLDDPQPFRVYRISKNIDGTLTAYARHPAIYDAAGVVIRPFKTEYPGIFYAMGGIEYFKLGGENMAFYGYDSMDGSDIKFTLKSPCSARAAIKQVIDTFGCEAEYGLLRVSDDEPRLIATRVGPRRGFDKGATIRYGVDLVDYQQDEDNLEFYTGVYPFWAGYVDGWFWSKNYTVASLGEETVSAPGQFGFSRILTLDLSDKFDTKPTADQLREAAQNHIAENGIGVPDFGLAIKRYAIRENLALGDTARVYYPQIGVAASARVMSLTWDVLAEKTTDLEIGSIRASIASIVAGNIGSIGNLSAALYHRTNVDSSAKTTSEEGGTENAGT